MTIIKKAAGVFKKTMSSEKHFAKGTMNTAKAERDKINQAVVKAKGLGVAGGSTGVKKMAKKMKPKVY